MRMWMVDSKILCNKHLLGEHGELHKFLHNWVKKQSITGRIAVNSIEPKSYKLRHDILADEMIIRGMNHKSPIEQPDFSYLPVEHQEVTVDVLSNTELLLNRCALCFARSIQ